MADTSACSGARYKYRPLYIFYTYVSYVARVLHLRVYRAPCSYRTTKSAHAIARAWAIRCVRLVAYIAPVIPIIVSVIAIFSTVTKTTDDGFLLCAFARCNVYCRTSHEFVAFLHASRFTRVSSIHIRIIGAFSALTSLRCSTRFTRPSVLQAHAIRERVTFGAFEP